MNGFAEGWALPQELKARNYEGNQGSIFSGATTVDATLTAYYLVERAITKLFRRRDYHAASAYLLARHGFEQEPKTLIGPKWEEHRRNLEIPPEEAIEIIYRHIQGNCA